MTLNQEYTMTDDGIRWIRAHAAELRTLHDGMLDTYQTYGIKSLDLALKLIPAIQLEINDINHALATEFAGGGRSLQAKQGELITLRTQLEEEKARFEKLVLSWTESPTMDSVEIITPPTQQPTTVQLVTTTPLDPTMIPTTNPITGTPSSTTPWGLIVAGVAGLFLLARRKRRK